MTFGLSAFLARPAITRRIAVAVALGLPFSPVDGIAQDSWDRDPLVTDRPSFSMSANAVAPGRALLEGGYSFTKTGDDGLHDVGELLLRLGVVRGLEARVFINPFSVLQRPGPDEVGGPDDIEVGAKYNVIDESLGARPALALAGSAVFPVSGDERPDVIPSLTAAAWWTLTGGLSVGSNAGWAYAGLSGARHHRFLLSLMLSASFSRRWGAYAEYAAIPSSGGVRDENFVNMGLTFLISPDFQLDARFGGGLEGPRPNYFAGLGTAFRF